VSSPHGVHFTKLFVVTLATATNVQPWSRILLQLYFNFPSLRRPGPGPLVRYLLGCRAELLNKAILEVRLCRLVARVVPKSWFSPTQICLIWGAASISCPILG